ncbi:MAG: biotin carboxylase N-terminal domain-containing protein [Armatimonadota bacterium]|nr:biotin carboxylase N-terminal domain-containing protein [Armatimonadota bacterium]MDR7451190.1 biotin carboxylase N-terminal domain-containing protein [Armatimonadota bacterium]MDR7467205.1 biotin carboxylase N-terminal domain-containing protein [Armatimonadota bacterium]MDR7494867.1 biotin carboxylase N-terminal domain-containing protein [Armatimonadota bacterium]MDR7500071.1 biotin carboxylase N-terminal domain-containing protein [Armatimonadota bacterium]
MLIANRGEIALRVIRACRELGYRAVAVYSPVDRTAPHAVFADEAHPLPGDSPADSYLNIGTLIEIARAARVDAVHPGYGFLAENPAFARACEQAGLAFVGPPSDVLAICGDKARTRAQVAAAGVPVLPGTAPLDDEEVSGAALRIGFPLLVKAAGGGGGKGIHLVRSADELGNVVRLARGEAQAAFGDSRIYLERWLPGARHIEVQVLADGTGRVLALGERDCSVQRRHQKLIEESPAPSLDPPMRQRLLRFGVTAAEAIGYRGAGTVEFLVGGEECYFLEINARLQVEHPVTEVVTGIDLVAEQLHIARHGAMSVREAPAPRGHALECRISAEDPHQGFLPSLGRITAVREPGGPGVRVDSGLAPGLEVTRHYDPLLAKVITWGPSRRTAMARMRRALEEMVVDGVATTIPFHLWALADPEFVAARHTTAFVSRWEAHRPGRHERTAIIAAAAAAFLREQEPRLPAAVPPGGWLRAAREEGLRGG